MNDTGRIRKPLDWRARRIVFGNRADQAIENELRFYLDIDRAHLVMLVERGLISRDHGRRLLVTMDRLVAQDYAPLRGRTAQRGLYLLYEDWLIEVLGEKVGGAVHLGRSRNDINATVLLLRLRPVYRRLTSELLRLLAVLVRRCERYAGLTMPIHTHYRAALPITYGHYLAGVALALQRDLRGIEQAAAEMDRSPLGAGAAGGTSIPIDTERTAQLLGFTSAVLHSVDAVASRDLVLRLLSAASVLGVTLSRVATDLQFWSTAESDCIRFPDELVGSSSMMPQKRNAFLLEHVQGRAGALLGAFTAAAATMHSTPFSNSVAVGTEGVKPLWSALTEVTEAMVLTRLAICGAQPQPDRMKQLAVDGFTTATALANRLVQDGALSFRQAHRLVGQLVSLAVERGESLETVTRHRFGTQGIAVHAESLDPDAVAEGADYGGGPSATSLGRVIDELRHGWSRGAHRLAERARHWSEGARALQAAVADVMATEPRLMRSSSFREIERDD